VNSGNPDVIKRLDAVAHRLHCHERFFGNRNICRACTGNKNLSFAMDSLIPLDQNSSRTGKEFRPAVELLHTPENLWAGARDQDVVLMRQHPFHDSLDLSDAFAKTEDDLWKSLANHTVMIDSGKAHILKGQVPQFLKSAVDGKPAILHPSQNLSDVLFRHDPSLKSLSFWLLSAKFV
jgi:hypothetical protein